MASMLLALIYNISLLLSIALLFVMIIPARSLEPSRPHQIASGVIVGLVGMVLMLTPWLTMPGIIFDTRSVLLSISGLFFGPIPTLVAMAMTAALRVYQGGVGVTMGVLVIFATGMVGILWHWWRRDQLAELNGRELYLLGMVTHLAMLALMPTLPRQTAAQLFNLIALPVLVFYPIGTVLLGRLIVSRLRREQTIADLQRSEERYRLLVETSLDGILLTQPDGTVLAANPAACEVLGRSQAEILRLGRDGLVDVTDPRLAQALATRARTGKFVGELTMVRGDGTKFPVALSSAVAKIENGPAWMSVVIRDMTATRLIEENLRQSEARYRRLLEIAPVGIVVHAEGEIRFVNPVGAQLLGAPNPGELVGKQLIDLVQVESIEPFVTRLERLAAGESVEYPIRAAYSKHDGTVATVEFYETLIQFDGQAAVQMIMADVSDKVAAEAELRLYAAALESAANAIVITDVKAVIKWANPAFTRLTGYTQAESRGRNLPELVRSGVMGADFYQQMYDTITKGQVWHGMVVNRRKDGSLYTEEMTITPVRNEQDVVTHYIAVKNDVTQRQQQERELATVAALNAALRQTASRGATVTAVFDQLHGSFPVQGILLAGQSEEREGLWIEAGDGVWAELCGTQATDLEAIYDAVLSRRQPIALGSDAAAPVAPTAPAVPVRLAAESCPSIVAVPMIVGRQAVGLLMVGMRQPLTESDMQLLASFAEIGANALFREMLHERLAAQANLMATIIATVPHGLVLIDGDGQLLLTNPKAEPLLAQLAPDMDLAENRLTHMGGRALVSLLSPAPMGTYHELQVGEQIFEVIAQAVSSTVDTNQWVILIDDVTQERRVQGHIQQQERLATVGQLAAGIAHDFNNIMGVIVLYAEIVGRAKGLSPKDRTRLATIKEQGHYASALIRQILDFSRQGNLERRTFDLRPLVKEHVKLLQRTLPEAIAIRLSFEELDYTVRADPTSIQQVLMNLAINARDAMPQGGTLRIGLERIKTRPGEMAPLPAMQAGEWIRLTIADTGIGIREDSLPHIFDPFFTTKEPGKGTGLGLAQVHGIVMQHDGHIDVASSPGAGATFTIYLPAYVSPIEPDDHPPSPGEPAGRQELVLLVEDNTVLRTALADMLSANNYDALVASDGQEALHLLRNHPRTAEIALVLSDRVMPNLGGDALIEHIRRDGWGMPVILMSGHPVQVDAEDSLASGGVTYLQKPFSPQKLAATIAEVLDGKGER